MMKQILVSAVLFLELLLIAVLPVQGQLADAEAWWLIVSPNTDTRTRSHLDSLVSLLKDWGTVPSKQIHRIEGDQCTPDRIQAAIGQLANKIRQGDRLIFYYRGFVTKPRRLNSIYYLTHGVTPENFADGFETRQLNRWFRESSRNPAIVILDSYTTLRNLAVFYANRQPPGEASYISIQPATAIDEDLFAQNLLTTFQNDAADLDDNRQLSIIELHEYIVTNERLQQGILVPTGDIETIVLKLSPMLKVVTVPDGASVFLNGEEIGKTPQRIVDNLKGGTYEVEARKPGYRIPSARSVQVDPVQGKSVHLSWDLESIEVYGSVKAADGEALEGRKVWVDGTAYEQNKQDIGEDGSFRLPANIVDVLRDSRSDTKVLEPEKTYTLRAESGELYHAEATFTLPAHESIRRDLILVKKTWFEVAQMRFDRKTYDGAISAFQNGIESTTEFPPMSPAFTQMLFDSFSAVIDRVDVQNIAYVVATAKLADRLGFQDKSKAYWTQVKSRAVKGTPESKLATKRLRELNAVRNLINFGIFIILLVVLISGGYTFQKHRKARKGQGNG